MFDQNMYNTYFDAAGNVLKDNMHRFGNAFAEQFMAHHDIRNGQVANTGINNMYNAVTQRVHQMSGGTGRFDANMLYQAVGDYIVQVYNNWLQTQNRQNASFGNSGGFGFQNNGGFNRSSGFGQSSGSFGFQQPRPQAASHLVDHSIATPQAPVAQAPIELAPAPAMEIKPMSVVGHNPLDALVDQKIELTVVPGGNGATNWGMGKPKDTSISVMRKDLIRTRDETVLINVVDAFEHTYFNNQMDVVRDFFRIVPDQFLGDHFITRVFYNHIERLDLPTYDFLDARKRFIDGVTNSIDNSVYRVIIGIMDSMMHGPRKSLEKYLVSHINRALHLSLGMEQLPQLRIKFNQIEDLDELLGPSFQSRLLEVPNAKAMISYIVNTAILNALSGYSDVMFVDKDSRDIDVVRSSTVFPHSVTGVYPNKETIPASGTPEAAKFFEMMQLHELDKHTYVRSIRSVVITNILGQTVLPNVGDKPTVIRGQIPSILNEYILNHRDKLNLEPQCRKYDLHSDQTAEQDYEAYLRNPDLYERETLSKIVDFNPPSLPVDQTIFAIQFKVSPKDYLMALDLVTVMDHPTGGGFTLLAKAKIDDLKITQ